MVRLFRARGVPIDLRTDIFSVGALLFEMATGLSPFHRENFMDTLHAVAFDETPSMNAAGVHVPPELERIVGRCLQKRPEDRYPSARILADELRRVRRDTETGLAQKTSWRQRMLEAWEQLRRQPPSRSAWLAAGAVGFGIRLVLFRYRKSAWADWCSWVSEGCFSIDTSAIVHTESSNNSCGAFQRSPK